MITISLDLNNKDIDSEMAKDLGNSLSRFKNLQSLTIILTVNKIRDAGFIGILQGLKNCTNMQSLQLFLGQNQLTSNSA